MITYYDILRRTQEYYYKKSDEEILSSFSTLAKSKFGHMHEVYGENLKPLDINQLSRRSMESVLIRKATYDSFWRAAQDELEPFQDENVRKAVAEEHALIQQKWGSEGLFDISLEQLEEALKAADDAVDDCIFCDSEFVDDHRDLDLDEIEKSLDAHESKIRAAEEYRDKIFAMKKIKEEYCWGKFMAVYSYEEALYEAQKEVYLMSEGELRECYGSVKSRYVVESETKKYPDAINAPKRLMESWLIKISLYRKLLGGNYRISDLEMFQNDDLRLEIHASDND